MTNTLGNNDQYCWFSVKSSNIIRDLTRPSGPLGHEDMVHYITSSLVIDKYFFKIYLKMLTNVLKCDTEGYNTPKYSLNRWPSFKVHH